MSGNPRRSGVPESQPDASNWAGWYVVLVLIGIVLPERSVAFGKEVRAVNSAFTRGL